MVQGIIKADDRHTMRRIRTAMQGNVIRALVELITNADDSYIRLEAEKKTCEGVIEIVYTKEGHRGLFSVRDYAEGMSREDVQSSFSTYGAATSGMKAGKSVRGYFGQGAKDALVSNLNGRICTFKDGRFVECRLFAKNNTAMYDIRGPIPAASKLQEDYKIGGNGTVAYFEVDPQKGGRVPRFETVHEGLANNYLLRKIMTNPRRKLFLRDETVSKVTGKKIGQTKKMKMAYNLLTPEETISVAGDYDALKALLQSKLPEVDKMLETKQKKAGENRRLRYQMPEGKEILAEDFTVSHDSFDPFPVHVSIWRAEKELNQTGDERNGGLLIVDDQDVVLGISLFRYDTEPLAAHFFGEVKIQGFRTLLDKEEPVLSEERDGLVARHPFCQILIPEIERRIEEKVKEEKLRKQKEKETKVDSEEARRYKKAFSVLNEIAEVEVQAVINLGQDPTAKIEDPPNGFCLYPPSAQITVGKRYAFEVRLNTNVVPHGSVIEVKCTNSKIRVLTPEVRISSEDAVGVLRKYITVEGCEPNIEGTLQAIAGRNSCQARVYVITEKELLLGEGMVFQPQSLTLRPNQPRKLHLCVYVKKIVGGSIIKISSDNESIHVSKQEIIVNEADATRHVAKYELEVWGDGPGQDAIVTAEYETYIALLEVRVRSKKETREKSRKGMFNEPEFSDDDNPLQRISYSAETGKVIIYANFPSVQHYLGTDCQYRKTLAAQVLIADLVAERCFYEIAKKKVESSGVTFRPEAIHDRIQRDAFELSRKYGKKVHEALVDQNLVNESRGPN